MSAYNVYRMWYAMDKRYYVKLEFTEDEYRRIVDEARRRGYALPRDMLKDIILDCLERSGEARGYDVKIDERKLAEAISRRVERTIADLINPFTAKIDEIQQRLADIIESVEASSQKHSQERYDQGRSEYRYHSESRRAQWRSSEEHSQPGAIDRLKQQKVVFESDVSWMRAPERFFRKLEREGAVVLDAGGERIAADREFWSEFKRSLSEVGIRDPDEAASLVESMLGVKAGELFRKLVKAGLAYYNDEAGVWELAIDD